MGNGASRARNGWSALSGKRCCSHLATRGAALRASAAEAAEGTRCQNAADTKAAPRVRWEGSRADRAQRARPRETEGARRAALRVRARKTAARHRESLAGSEEPERRGDSRRRGGELPGEALTSLPPHSHPHSCAIEELPSSSAVELLRAAAPIPAAQAEPQPPAQPTRGHCRPAALPARQSRALGRAVPAAGPAGVGRGPARLGGALRLLKSSPVLFRLEAARVVPAGSGYCLQLRNIFFPSRHQGCHFRGGGTFC